MTLARHDERHETDVGQDTTFSSAEGGVGNNMFPTTVFAASGATAQVAITQLFFTFGRANMSYSIRFWSTKLHQKLGWGENRRKSLVGRTSKRSLGGRRRWSLTFGQCDNERLLAVFRVGWRRGSDIYWFIRQGAVRCAVIADRLCRPSPTALPHSIHSSWSVLYIYPAARRRKGDENEALSVGPPFRRDNDWKSR